MYTHLKNIPGKGVLNLVWVTCPLSRYGIGSHGNMALLNVEWRKR